MDPTVLDALIAELGDSGTELRAELIADYLSSAKSGMSALASAAATGDGQGVAFAAHSMRSGSATMGAVRLAGLLEFAERRARAGAADLLALSGPAVAEYQRVSTELNVPRPASESSVGGWR